MTKKMTRGFTLIELMMGIVIFSFIVLAFTSFLTRSQTLSQRAWHNQDVMSSKLNAISSIVQDLNAAKRTSVGSLVLNGGFEMADNTTGLPSYWSSVIGGPGNCQYLNSVSTDEIRSGFRSLQLQTAGNPLWTNLNSSMTLIPGVAYMLTAWYRVTITDVHAKVVLVDNAGTEVAQTSTEGYSSSWQRMVVRYPTTGLYGIGPNNPLTNDQANIRLYILSGSGNTGTILYDDVALTPINSILISTNPAEVNVTNTATDLTNFNENTGFRFDRAEVGGGLEMYRYRIDSSGSAPYLLREKFNTMTTKWEKSGPPLMAQSISILKISYDPNNNVPGLGKETPLQIQVALKDSYMAKQNLKDRVETLTIFPEAQ